MIPAATAIPTPRTETDVAEGPPVTDLLKTNAEQFQYVIGDHGGDLTIATISDPLTFNLAIAKDASSSGVLFYLFEGLTETSWLTDHVEPLVGEILGDVRGRDDVDIPLA